MTGMLKSKHNAFEMTRCLVFTLNFIAQEIKQLSLTITHIEMSLGKKLKPKNKIIITITKKKQNLEALV